MISFFVSSFVGDCQIPLACSKFVEGYGKEIFRKNLYKNFILHLNNLYDFGVLPATSMRQIIKQLNSYRDDKDKIKKKQEKEE